MHESRAIFLSHSHTASATVLNSQPLQQNAIMSSISYYDNTDPSDLTPKYDRLMDIASACGDSYVLEEYEKTIQWVRGSGGTFERAIKKDNGPEAARLHLSALRSALVDAGSLTHEDAELTKAAA